MSETISSGKESTSSAKPAISSQPESDTPLPLRRTIDRAFQHAWRRLHVRFPQLVPTPNRGDREFLRRRDVESNLATRVPEGERLQQIAMWGIEIFGPAEADSLNAAIKHLGWHKDQPFGLNTNPASWINEQRTYGTEGNLNLGHIERPGESRFLLKGRTAPLPEMVDYAHGYIYQLSPSVTAVIICFVLTESAGHAYHEELNIDRKTGYGTLKDGYRYFDVEHVKRHAVGLARTKSRTQIVKWFSVHLPGFFSRAPDCNRLPTAELISTICEPLLVGVRAQTRPEADWTRLLSQPGHKEIWTLEDCAGLALCWPESDGDLRYHAIANLQTSLLTADQLKYRGGDSDAVHASIVSDHIEGIMVNFAAIAALREIIRLLRLTPSSISADTTSRKGTTTCIEQIRLYFDRSIGIPALTSELASRSEKVHSYKWTCSTFQTQPWPREEKPIEIFEALRSRTHFLASQAQSLEGETREHLEQLSGILSTRENIRTQARMELVAVFAVILSVVSLAVAVMSVDKFSDYINQYVESLSKTK
ncbi:hypothetical protein [Deefgea rivuli]|uniref:hypothetical protein n=1 Tax=Deefgea rivuli TaxID=400948 RepID=UPI0012EC3598|nr:hypothetical protein [Deefgea rivuli]